MIETAALRALQAFVAAVLALSLFLAVVVPFHATDALVYGQLSQLIGREGGFLIDGLGYQAYNRPLFYAPQGWLWWLLGGHEWIGRLLSLAFFVLLLWALHRLASERAQAPLTAWLTVGLALACPDVVSQAFAGQTDVPVAALVACAGVVAFGAARGWRTAVLLAVLAAAAVLAKATALPAIVALGLACLLGDRAGVRERLLWRAVPLAAGIGAALVYGVVMARHFGLALNTFLLGGYTQPGRDDPTAVGAGHGGTSNPADRGLLERVGDAFEDLWGSERIDTLLRAEWLGPYLRLTLIFALVYAVVRVAGGRHRPAVAGAFVIGLVWWALGASGSLIADNPGAALGTIASAGVLAGAWWCPPDAVPARLLLGRMLVWLALPLLSWTVFGIVEDSRTLSPAWPGLLVLVGAAFATGVAGLRTRASWAAAAAIVVALGLAALDLRNLDAIGTRPDGTYSLWRGLADLPPSAWTDPDAARSAADSQLGGLVADARAARPPGGDVLTNDGRLGFFLPGDWTPAQAPRTCADVEGHAVVALLLNVDLGVDVGALPCLEPVRVVPGSYGVWRVAGG